MIDQPISALALIGDLNGCSMWRAIWPVSALQSRGYPAGWAFSPPNREAWARAREFDMVVCNRFHYRSLITPDTPTAMTLAQAFEIRDWLHAGNCLMVGEFDDDLWLARDDQKSEVELGVAASTVGTVENRASARIWDGITVTNERLRTILADVVPDTPVEVVPNAIDLAYWAKCLEGHGRHPELEGLTTVGWAGGDRYDRDVENVAEAWRIIADKHPEVHFVIMGHQPQVLVNAVPVERLHQIAWMPLKPEGDTPAYPVGLAQMDICCCSVAPTRFNGCKTPIRVFEATASGAAVVATRWLYGPVIEHRKDGLLADTVDEWVAGISRMIRNRGQRHDMRLRMMSKVRRQFSLEANLWRWPAAWESLREQARHKLAGRVLVPMHGSRAVGVQTLSR